MKKIIKFTKIRAFTFLLSLAVIGVGVFSLSVKGLNLGIDFSAGINQRIQIAPPAAQVTWTDSDAIAEMNISNQVMTVTIKGENREETLQFPFSEYSNIGALKGALDGIDKLEFKSLISDMTATQQILTFNRKMKLGTEPVVVNIRAGAVTDQFISIEDVRPLVAALGEPEIKVIGEPADQEFIIRVQDPGTDKEFSGNVHDSIVKAFADKFGADHIIDKENEYIGPTLARTIWRNTGILILVVMVLILLYIWFRFKMAYAVSAIIALVHDVTIMFGLISFFQIEFSTVTIAAVLTIFGYSLNDTIVVFDRIRENVKLMKETNLKIVIDTSITQSLSRTIITSLTTFLAVLALFIFATGSIRIFALNMIFGIIVGTYSSIFIASPIYLAITSSLAKRKAVRDEQRFGAIAAAKKESGIAPAEVKAEENKIVEIPKLERKLKGKRKKKK
ncbi:MAG: protein translocase subunit SecF [Spirochaetales bacterium]|nr:protein translocase subunit SecF [Spirochaetales bacterium]